MSTETIEYLKKIVNNRTAYFVAGTPSFQDVHLSCATGYPFLTGNPVVNLKFCSAFYTKRFLHVNSFPYIIFSQKIKKEADLEVAFTRILVDNPFYSNWRIEIDGEFGGRGTAMMNVDAINQVQTLKNIEDAHEREAMIPELTQLFKKVIPGYSLMACNKLFFSFQDFKKILLSRGGFIEAVPKGKIKTIGVLLFISPTGKRNR